MTSLAVYIIVADIGKRCFQRRAAMASVLSSLFTRDPKAHFAYDLPQTSFHTSKGVSMGRSFKKVIDYAFISLVIDLLYLANLRSVW